MRPTLCLKNFPTLHIRSLGFIILFSLVLCLQSGVSVMAQTESLPFTEKIQLQSGETLFLEAGSRAETPHMMEALLRLGDKSAVLIPSRVGVVSDMALARLDSDRPVALLLISQAGAMETQLFAFAIDTAEISGALITSPDGDEEGIHSLSISDQQNGADHIEMTLYYSPGPHWSHPVEFKKWVLSSNLSWKPQVNASELPSPVKILKIGERAFMQGDWKTASAQYSRIVEMDRSRPFSDPDDLAVLESALQALPGIQERCGYLREALKAYERLVDRFPSGQMAEAAQTEASFLDMSLRFAPDQTREYFDARWAMERRDRRQAFILASKVAAQDFGDKRPYLASLIQRSALLAARASELEGNNRAAIENYRKCVSVSAGTREADMARQALAALQGQSKTGQADSAGRGE